MFFHNIFFHEHIFSWTNFFMNIFFHQHVYFLQNQTRKLLSWVVIFLADFEILDMFFFFTFKTHAKFSWRRGGSIADFLVFSKSQKSYELEWCLLSNLKSIGLGKIFNLQLQRAIDTQRDYGTNFVFPILEQSLSMFKNGF